MVLWLWWWNSGSGDGCCKGDYSDCCRFAIIKCIFFSGASFCCGSGGKVLVGVVA